MSRSMGMTGTSAGSSSECWVRRSLSGRVHVASGLWGQEGHHGHAVADSAPSLGPGELTITGLPSTMEVPEGDTARLLCVVAGESVNIRWSR